MEDFPMDETLPGIQREECSFLPGLAITALPVDTQNPFQNPFCDSDVVLVVEGQKLHVHKLILSMLSSVFNRMFHGDFLESGTKEVEIKDTSHKAMLQFLLQMYPVHCSTPFPSDTVMTDILPLADFYQVDHISRKCEDYIGVQLNTPDFQATSLNIEKIMLYIMLCDKFRLNKHYDKLLNIAMRMTVTKITENAHFNSLQPATQVELLKRRCKMMETGIFDFVYKLEEPLRRQFGACQRCSSLLEERRAICRDCLLKSKTRCFNFSYK